MTALEDLRILDLSRLLPGPFCSLLLADLGADVIKVEDTDAGDYMRWMPPLDGGVSAMFPPLNRNKRSVAIDLKQVAGRDAFLRLVDTTDVVLESFRPGVLDRLGVGWDVLHARNARVILCSITGYGQDGPYRDRAGHDLDYAAIAGALSMSGDATGRPIVPGLQAGDLAGGALDAAVAILAALHQRERTGRGQHCDVAMLDGLVSWMAHYAALHFACDVTPAPGSLTLTGRHPCYRIYRCADGYLALGALEPKFWRAFVDAIGLPELADSGFAEGDDCDAIVQAVEGVLTSAGRSEWMRRLQGLDVCCEPVLDVAETFAHEQVRHRRLRIEPGVAGPAAQCGPPIRLSDSEFRVRHTAPVQGAHTREVLQEAGLASEDVDALLAAGVVR